MKRLQCYQETANVPFFAEDLAVTARCSSPHPPLHEKGVRLSLCLSASIHRRHPKLALNFGKPFIGLSAFSFECGDLLVNGLSCGVA